MPKPLPPNIKQIQKDWELYMHPKKLREKYNKTKQQISYYKLKYNWKR